MTKEYRKVSELHNWDKNPRSISKDGLERLKKQITKLGQYKPLLITEDGTVLGGNMRLKAYNDMGINEVWVSVVEADTEEKKIEYALSDNDRVGKYEGDQLSDLIGNFPEVEWNDYAVDLKEPELVSDIMDRYSETEEDEPPAVEEGEADSKLGEVYTLGRHRLMCGDATKIEDVEKLMDGKKADMVFTDPPYGVGYTGGSKTWEMIKGDAKDQDIAVFYGDALANLSVMTKIEASWYICHAGLKAVEVFTALRTNGFTIKNIIIWSKNNAQFGILGANYHQKHEPIIFGTYGKKYNWYGQNNEVTVWEIARASKNEFHPTQKPVALVARAIKNSSKEEDIVADLFGGSGSTLIACEQTNRICYMMELDPHYVDVIRKRYENFISNRKETANGKS